MKEWEEKVNLLKSLVEDAAKHNLIVAFSGGVDSSLLLRLAVESAARTGSKVYAVTVHTMLHPVSDLETASRAASEMGAEHVVLHMDELREADIGDNPPDRCYRCKKRLFLKMKEKAAELGAQTILEGTNEDDLHVYRPGIKALRELSIESPLAQAGFTKQEVRRLAEQYGMSASNRPSAPCLATRFPYGVSLSYKELRRVEEGERYLKDFGLYNVRLRIHGDVARIEADAAQMPVILEHRQSIAAFLKKLGYPYVTLDLEGFRSGSMDETLAMAGL